MKCILMGAAVMVAWGFTSVFSSLSGQSCAPDPMSPPWPASWESEYHVAADWGGATYEANTYFHDNGTVLDRPFLFCEGIDFGQSGEAEVWGAGATQLGDFGWDAFWGCDQTNYPMMAMMPVLLDSLLERGYDLVLVDFADGTADIRANAAVLRKILALIRQYQVGIEPAVVGGASMGGQIARWALCSMENDGQWPCAAAYLSLDSPHNGANIPLGLQQLVQDLSQLSSAPSALASALQSPAARQLLRYQLDGVPDVRTQYQEELDALGWPQQSYNIGIANGGQDPLPGNGQPLLDYSFSALEWSEAMTEWTELFSVEIHGLPGDPNHPLGSPSQPVTSYLKLPIFCEADEPFVELSGNFDTSDLAEAGHLDFCPGGTRPSIAQLVGILNDTLDANFPSGSLAGLFGAPHIGPEDFQPLHSFIATTSALGSVLHPGWTWHVPDSLTDSSTLGSPFDVAYIAPLNEPHSEINPGNMAFLLDALDATRLPLDLEYVVDERNLICTAGHAWQLRSAHCAPSGQLGLHAGFSAYAPDLAPAGEQPGQLELLPCGTGLLIEGLLDLGGGGTAVHFQLLDGSQFTAQGAVIRIHSGSRLHLHSGSVLDLRNTILEISAGAELLLDQGSTVFVGEDVGWNLLDQAQIQLGGQVFLEEDARLVCNMNGQASLVIGSGNAAQFSLEEASELIISGSGTGCSINLGAQAGLAFAGAGQMGWDHVSVNLEAGAMLESHSAWELEHVRGHGSSGAHWESNARVEMEECVFTGMHFLHHNGQWKLDATAFTGAPIDVGGGWLNWRFADLEDAPLSGEQLELSSRFYDCIFHQGGLGVRLAGGGTQHFDRCEFLELETGLELADGSGKLSCNQFIHCDLAILSRRAALEMAAPDQGWNRFEMNGTHLMLDRAPLPLLAHGSNHFGNNNLNWAEGTVDGNTVNVGCGQALNWPIPGQSWDWPASIWQIQTGLHVLIPGCTEQTVVVAVDNAAVGDRPCPGADRKSQEVVEGLVVHPNPAAQRWVHLECSDHAGSWFSVLMADGRLKMRQQWASGKAKLDCGGWSPGLYLVFDEQTGASARLMISRSD